MFFSIKIAAAQCACPSSAEASPSLPGATRTTCYLQVRVKFYFIFRDTLEDNSTFHSCHAESGENTRKSKGAYGSVTFAEQCVMYFLFLSRDIKERQQNKLQTHDKLFHHRVVIANMLAGYCLLAAVRAPLAEEHSGEGRMLSS